MADIIEMGLNAVGQCLAVLAAADATYTGALPASAASTAASRATDPRASAVRIAS